jgi:hypothetical protein
MLKQHVSQIESKALEAKLPKESYFVEDLDKYAMVFINKSSFNGDSATQKQIYDFQDKLLLGRDVERILNIHQQNKTNTLFLVKFRN